MKKLKLKKNILAILVISVCFITTLITSLVTNMKDSDDIKENPSYVSNAIITKEQAVINTTSKIIAPYLDQSVQIGKNYYDYKGTQDEQENSITYHENTYIQNSGVDYILDQPFDVIAILDGTVINVREDELLGNIVEIQHDNDYISIYQSLSEIKVKKGDNISQGHIIGKSGTNELDKDLGNHLHFELYIGGQVVNPINYINKDVLTNNN